MTRIDFEKVEGLGNHFVLIDELRSGAQDWPSLAQSLCAYGTGIGADGLLVVGEGASCDTLARMRMFNPDGSEDMCGNGLRCVAHVAVASRTPLCGGPWRIETIAGPRYVWVDDASSPTAMVRTTLGKPILRPAEMPADIPGEEVLDQTLPVGRDCITASLVSMGTPHCIVFGPLPEGPRFERISRAVEKDTRFPEGISVMWALPVTPHEVRLRIWERAVGETRACGTGAAASAVAGILTGRLASPVRVAMPGGVLEIEWQGPGHDVVQVGPARRVYRGTYMMYD